MALAVLEGAKEKGAEAVLFTAAEFSASMLGEYDAIAFGCPAMGDEVLEEDEFQPMWDSCEDSLNGKNIALFGSYGWGNGEWMRDWESRITSDGATILNGEGLIANNEPTTEVLDECKEIGRKLANM